MIRRLSRRGAARWLATALLAASTAGCSDFLQVQNPGAIGERNISNAAYASLLMNGVIGEFQPAFATTALYSAVFTDELANFHGFFENIDIDRRAVSNANGTMNGQVFTPLQSARFMADTTTSLLRGFLGDSAAHDPRVARSLDYAGYSYTLLGEQFCQAPISLSRAYSSDELLGFALTRFKDAIQVATAARSFYTALGNTAAGKAGVASADSLLALAQIGAARVSLDLGKPTDAAAFASTVANNAALPESWGFTANYSDNSPRQYNAFYGAASGGGSAEWVGITNTPFETVTGDPRIPHPDKTERTQQGDAVVPNSPLMFGSYNGTPVGADFTRSASITFASKLEARYIVAEAQGPNATNIAFLNSRRAIGGAAPLAAPSVTEYRLALAEQRARDLYLAGYRLGDLRRYKKLYNMDLWQKGEFKSPVAAPPTFGDDECWPIPLAEYAGNPNLPKP